MYIMYAICSVVNITENSSYEKTQYQLKCIAMTTHTGQASPGSQCPPPYRLHPPVSRQDTLRHPLQHTEHHFPGN